MSYQLEAGEETAAGIRRIVLEQIDAAITELREFPEGKDQAVHEARKRGKRIRGALRLVRDELGETVFQQENAHYRDAGRQLAEVRDSLVIVRALDALTVRFAKDVRPDSFSTIRARLEERRLAIRQELLEESKVMNEAADVLAAGRERMLELGIGVGDRKGFEMLAPGLRRVYRRGRRRMVRAYATRDRLLFHDWRKRVKYLWYQLEILGPCWAAGYDFLVVNLHRLSDYLGDAHDLLELKNILVKEGDLFGSGPEINQLINLIDRWIGEFEAAARPLGVRLYAERPRAFVDRAAAYWQAWEMTGEPYEGPALAPDAGEMGEGEFGSVSGLVGTREAAEKLGCSQDEVRKMIRAGKLSGAKVGNMWIVPAAVLARSHETDQLEREIQSTVNETSTGDEG